MHVTVKDPNKQSIRYLDVNSLYPYVMVNTEFFVGHPVIRRDDNACGSLFRDLDRRGVSFIGICLVIVLAPKDLMVSYLPHKIDGKLMFFLCRECSLNVIVQHQPCFHNQLERSWVDTYTSIDMCGAFQVSYKVLEYFELWHYLQGGSKFFKDIILNIV